MDPFFIGDLKIQSFVNEFFVYIWKKGRSKIKALYLPNLVNVVCERPLNHVSVSIVFWLLITCCGSARNCGARCNRHFCQSQMMIFSDGHSSTHQAHIFSCINNTHWILSFRWLLFSNFRTWSQCICYGPWL